VYFKNTVQVTDSDWKSLPIPMKLPQGVVIGDSLFIGGGYTKFLGDNFKLYMYKNSLGSWVSLPPPPYVTTKLSGLASFENKLVVMGGKEMRLTPGDSGREYVHSNQVSTWNLEEECWESTLPAMSVGRVLPVVFAHGSYLIAGGGHRGVLEPQVEILDSNTMQWKQGPDLPIQCHQKNSVVVQGTWYLLEECIGVIYYTEIETYIKYAFAKLSENTGTVFPAKWLKLPKLTFSQDNKKPFRLASLGSQLVACTEIHKRSVMYLLQHDNTWSMVIGQIFPLITPTALVLSIKDTLLVMGGKKKSVFSDIAYQVTIIQEQAKDEQMPSGRYPQAMIQEICGPEEDEPIH